MTPAVHILVTVRNPALLPMALLVFKTLRVGFPTAPVHVYSNGLGAKENLALTEAAQNIGANLTWLRPTSHDLWVESLLQRERSPFWICDPDMVFFDNVEKLFPANPAIKLAGRFEPGFAEEWTHSWHVERLHTCLMYLDPAALRTEQIIWLERHVPKIFPWAETHFVRQHFIPRARQMPLFYDTCAGLYHALGGTAFDEPLNEAFEHLHCGSYSDLIGKCESLADLPAVHAAVLADINNARGLRQAQDNYYQSRSNV